MYFEKQQKKSNRSDNLDSVEVPQEIPGFVVCHNYDWDDCGYHNWYCLHYFDKDNNHSIIGEFHLMHKDGQSCDYITEKESFKYLNEDFCSLGNNITYYESMYKTLGEDLTIEVLRALRDCAINVDIYNKFKDNTQFSASLTREFLPTEKALKLARYIIKGRTINDAYQFSFNFKPPYNKQSETNWNVNFKPSAPAFKRCAGIIGENGVGKTLLVSSFITSILTNNNELFNGKIPIFSSIIAIGSTPFDTFTEINGNNFTIPYTQCCLEQNPKEIATNLINDFHKIKARGTLEYTNFFTAFVKKIQKLLPTEDFNKVFIFQQETNTFLISKDELNYLLKKLSSGQLQTFLLLTKIYCNIFYDTLFIFDEPEIHLHPNAILSFFRLLNYLLDTFKSYAIITTHSPIVIREMVGENVFILKRLEGDSAYIGHCDHETFGENISLLFNDTFKYDDSCSIFNDYINRLIKDGNNYDAIIKNLELEGLSLNSRFTIRNLIEEHTHNENE